MILDNELTKKADSLVALIDEMTLCLVDLAKTIMELWESAQHSDELHQDILAILENGVRQSAVSGVVKRSQLEAFRKALGYLSAEKLEREQVDALRSLFGRVGFAPLGFVDPDRGRKGGLLLESFPLADLPKWRPEINLDYGRDPDDR